MKIRQFGHYFSSGCFHKTFEIENEFNLMSKKMPNKLTKMGDFSVNFGIETKFPPVLLETVGLLKSDPVLAASKKLVE